MRVRVKVIVRVIVRVRVRVYQKGLWSRPMTPGGAAMASSEVGNIIMVAWGAVVPRVRVRVGKGEGEGEGRARVRLELILPCIL